MGSGASRGKLPTGEGWEGFAGTELESSNTDSIVEKE